MLSPSAPPSHHDCVGRDELEIQLYGRLEGSNGLSYRVHGAESSKGGLGRNGSNGLELVVQALYKGSVTSVAGNQRATYEGQM